MELNNPDIHADEKVARGWTPGSVITLCNEGENCVQFQFQTGCGCWLPKTGTFTKPPGKALKQGREPSPQVQTTPKGHTVVELSFVGLTPPTTGQGLIVITLPYRREPRPSVTVIQHGSWWEYTGNSDGLSNLNNTIGDLLDWGLDASGLVNYGGGGGCMHDCSTANILE